MTIEQLADFDVKINIDNSSNCYAYHLNPQGAIHAESKQIRHRLIAITRDYPKNTNTYKPAIGILCDEKTEDNRGTFVALGATRYLSKAGSSLHNFSFDRYIID